MIALQDLFIGIAGMIGAGKTMLATALGKHLESSFLRHVEWRPAKG